MAISFHAARAALLAQGFLCFVLLFFAQKTLGQTPQLSAAQLAAVLPQAQRFSPKQGNPPSTLAMNLRQKTLRLLAMHSRQPISNRRKLATAHLSKCLSALTLRGSLLASRFFFIANRIRASA